MDLESLFPLQVCGETCGTGQGSRSCRSEEEDLLGGHKGLHGGLQRCPVVLKWDLSAGRRCKLAPADELAQAVHHCGHTLLVCTGRKELSLCHAWPSTTPGNTCPRPFRVPACDVLPAQACGMREEPPAQSLPEPSSVSVPW